MGSKELIKELNRIKRRSFTRCKESWKAWKKRKKLLKKSVALLSKAAEEFKSSGRYVGEAMLYEDESRIIVKVRSSLCDFSDKYAVGRKLRTIAFILDTVNLSLNITINGKIVEDKITVEDLKNENVLRLLSYSFNQAEYFECW